MGAQEYRSGGPPPVAGPGKLVMRLARDDSDYQSELSPISRNSRPKSADFVLDSDRASESVSKTARNAGTRQSSDPGSESPDCRLQARASRDFRVRRGMEPEL